jgi:hypothetical protein
MIDPLDSKSKRSGLTEEMKEVMDQMEMKVLLLIYLFMHILIFTIFFFFKKKGRSNCYSL